MKRAVLVLAALALLAGQLQAAPVSTDNGDKALVFTFSGLSNMSLGSYDGGVGLRYYIGDALALRPGINFGMASGDDESKNGTDVEAESSSWSLRASVALEKHRAAGSSSLSPYYGVGAALGAGHSESERRRTVLADSTLKEETASDSRNASVFLLAGFEWGFADGITLGGEYQFGARFFSSELELKNDVGPVDSQFDRSQFSLDVSAASLFLSVGW